MFVVLQGRSIIIPKLVLLVHTPLQPHAKQLRPLRARPRIPVPLPRCPSCIAEVRRRDALGERAREHGALWRGTAQRGRSAFDVVLYGDGVDLVRLAVSGGDDVPNGAVVEPEGIAAVGKWDLKR